jgi:hypothetical protein
VNFQLQGQPQTQNIPIKISCHRTYDRQEIDTSWKVFCVVLESTDGDIMTQKKVMQVIHTHTVTTGGLN